jgi:hypothetical protein
LPLKNRFPVFHFLPIEFLFPLGRRQRALGAMMVVFMTARASTRFDVIEELPLDII